MKREYRLVTGILFLCLSIGLFASVTHSEGKVHQVTGEISGINLAHSTVVVQVPVESQIFTVGGPLDSDATLTRNGSPADLKDFKVGETATVRWRSTPNGHVI
ncbi:MAG: hypothetical protein KJP06_03815 [Deltaproteobacteria bacterium]|nr:hypothetical protein [Deltaproteobacteria bacterium]